MGVEVGWINDRWRLLLTEDRAAFHAARPRWEAERLDSMHAELERGGMTIYDVGAECGDFSALYALWGCRVVCVEPQPRYWPSIRAHFEANEEYPGGCFVGFCDERTDARGSVPRPDWPACAEGQVIPDAGFLHLAFDEATPRTSIDHCAARVAVPDAITVDVEGAEYRVLLGARETLARHHPLLWVSVHSDEQWMAENYPNEGIDAIREYLEAFDYEGELLAEQHEQHWVFR